MRTDVSTRTPRWPSAAMIAGAAVAVLLAAGCGSSGGSSGGGGSQSATDFITQVTTQFARGQSGPLWDTLHPADQAVVSRARYMACQSNSGFDLLKIKVLQTYADTIDVAGTSTPSTAVSLRVSAEDGTTTATMHAIKLNGKWRWMLSPADYVAYKSGKCPSG
jgi:hypothetical protein